MEPASGTVTAWNSYSAMNPKGGGRFSTTVKASSIPEVQRFSSAWLAYQFIATNPKGEIVGRSPGRQDLMVSACGRIMIDTPTPPPGRNQTVVPPPIRNTLPPPTLIPSPTATYIIIK